MKRSVIVIVITFLCATLSAYAFAHSGRTDANGGHNSSSGYHYHHGYPAHSHVGGVCPYDFDDKTDHSNNSSPNISSDKDESNRIENNEVDDKISLPTNDSDDYNDTDSSDISGFSVFLKVVFGLALCLGLLISAAVIPEAILRFIFFVILKIPEDDEEKVPLQLIYSREEHSQENVVVKIQPKQIAQYKDYLSFISDD